MTIAIGDIAGTEVVLVGIGPEISRLFAVPVSFANPLVVTVIVAGCATAEVKVNPLTCFAVPSSSRTSFLFFEPRYVLRSCRPSWLSCSTERRLSVVGMSRNCEFKLRIQTTAAMPVRSAPVAREFRRLSRCESRPRAQCRRPFQTRRRRPSRSRGTTKCW